jgi:uncharacterized membrane protein YphA (DoxX/SURF4 family)
MMNFQSTYASLKRVWHAYWFSRESVIGLALFRIVFGILVLVFYVRSFFNFPFPEFFTEVGFLWSRQPSVWLPSVPALSTGAAYALAILLVAVTLMLIVGYRTRYAAAVGFVVHTYLVLAENVYNDNLTSAVSIYFFLLVFSHAGEFLSLDAWFRYGSGIPHPTPTASCTVRKLIIWQLAIMYISNAMMKVAYGFSDWTSGDIVVRALQDPTWAYPWVWPVVSNVEGPLRMVVQIGFWMFLLLGFGLLFSKTRLVAGMFGLAWHWVSLILTNIYSAWLIWVSPYILLVEPNIWDRYLDRLRARQISLRMIMAGCLAFGLIFTAVFV